jgi:DNA-binding MarR family transcriptional regulator
MNENELNLENHLSNLRIWVYLDRARFSVYRLREIELSQFGLTVEQNLILNILLSHGGSTTPQKIEELTMRQHHSISALINRMINNKYVTKQKNTRGAGSEIVITQNGQELYRKVSNNNLAKVFSILSIEEKKQLDYLLNLILERSRYLLGLSYTPPFRQYFNNINRENNDSGKIRTEEILSDYRLWTNINRASFAVYRLRELELIPFGLTPEQESILSLLVHLGGLATTKNIKALTMRQQHSIYNIINRMIKTGYVAKQKCENRAGFDVIITKKGKELYKKLPVVSFEIAFSALNIEERRQLAHLLILILTKARELLGYVPII